MKHKCKKCGNESLIDARVKNRHGEKMEIWEICMRENVAQLVKGRDKLIKQMNNKKYLKKGWNIGKEAGIEEISAWILETQGAIKGIKTLIWNIGMSYRKMENKLNEDNNLVFKHIKLKHLK